MDRQAGLSSPAQHNPSLQLVLYGIRCYHLSFQKAPKYMPIISTMLHLHHEWLPDYGQLQRYTHYSVFSGTNANHFWCLFGRVVVCYNSTKSTWKCACSLMKRSYVHKALARWNTLQHFPEVMTSTSTTSDSTDKEVEETLPTKDDCYIEQESNTQWAYPPTGDVLERMPTYLRKKKISSELPQELLDERRLLKAGLDKKKCMAQCRVCHEWYHAECEKIPASLFKSRKAFVCSVCVQY